MKGINKFPGITKGQEFRHSPACLMSTGKLLEDQ